MFGHPILKADLSKYTQQEIILAQEMHDEECVSGCEWGAFQSFFAPNEWLDLARYVIKDREADTPQKEALF